MSTRILALKIVVGGFGVGTLATLVACGVWSANVFAPEERVYLGLAALAAFMFGGFGVQMMLRDRRVDGQQTDRPLLSDIADE